MYMDSQHKDEYRLVCLDMDGVIFKDVNFWMLLHEKFGTFEQGKVLTEKYVRTDYARLVEEVVVKLWKGKDARPYYDLVDSLVYLPGVKDTFDFIKKNTYKTALITASSLDVARRVQKDFGVDYIFANELVIRDGKVSGEFNWPIGHGAHKKAEIVLGLCNELGISPKQCIYIGDSDNDIESFELVGLSIAFNCSLQKLKDVATYIVDSSDLSDIIKYVPARTDAR